MKDSLLIQFHNDTSQIEQSFRNKIEIGYTTAEIIRSTYQMEEDYNTLLERYYDILLSWMQNANDKTILIEAQDSWLKFKESETKLINALGYDIYTGGGSMWRIVTTSRAADLTKKRLLEIYDYLVDITLEF